MPKAWSLADADHQYLVSGWGDGYFQVNSQGGIEVDVQRNGKRTVSLRSVVDGLRERGIHAPVVIRFDEILKDRLRVIHEAFQKAISDHKYQGNHFAVYPIKVNQQRHVVEEVIRAGEPFGFGIEVGSKPELLAAMPLTVGFGDRLIICNGFKDDRYIEAVVIASKLGRKVVPVVESFRELQLLIRHAQRHDVRPKIGVRVKLASRGVGRWQDSSGHKAKFGLMVGEVLRMFHLLAEHGMEDCLELVHCHVGSQIQNIRLIKNVINELGQFYVELARMGAKLKYLDIGGGLGVDYDGTQRDTECSMNYTLEDYAADVVFRVCGLCDRSGVEHPDLITESGRAVVASHSVLVFEVLGSQSASSHLSALRSAQDWPLSVGEIPRPVEDLFSARDHLSPENLEETYHDAMQARDEVLDLFSLGYLGLECRALAERIFWEVCYQIRDLARLQNPNDESEAMQQLEEQLSEVYFCNFSVFQSLPDAWAIQQQFPVVPLQRLDEEPKVRAVLADLTCDSDGRIDRFISNEEPKKALSLHPLEENEPYYLGVFLTGAYQETLGDLHNLFGDTHVVHISVAEGGSWTVAEVAAGDTTQEVLRYVQYDPDQLTATMRKDCERAVREGRVTPSESQVLLRFYESGLRGYTYLEREDFQP